MKKKKMRGAIPWKTVAVMAVIGLIACAAAWMLESRPQAMETVGLRISEVMADTDGISSDWIEIENTSNTEIRLYGYVLASAAEPKKAFVFPNCSIAPGKFLVVMADGSKAGLKDGGLSCAVQAFIRQRDDISSERGGQYDRSRGRSGFGRGHGVLPR